MRADDVRMLMLAWYVCSLYVVVVGVVYVSFNHD